MEEKAKEILKAVYVCETDDNIKKVVEALESAFDPPNRICEVLGISKRDNRKVLREFLKVE